MKKLSIIANKTLIIASLMFLVAVIYSCLIWIYGSGVAVLIIKITFLFYVITWCISMFLMISQDIDR